MKIIFDHPSPFLLAHGGFQIQIEQTKAALADLGIPVEYLRWWDDSQTGDIIHFFGRPSETYVALAHKKGIKVVVADLLTQLGARSSCARLAQKGFISVAKATLPQNFRTRLAWETYSMADACIAVTAWEANLMASMFGAPFWKLHVVPNGVEDVFFHKRSLQRGNWLVCTATITERKRILELAEAALIAQTPVWIIGKPYRESDPYAQAFTKLASENKEFIRYEGSIQDRGKLAAIYHEARGFVLLSTEESLSLSALEASASECPLLLSDLPWARTVFKDKATYCPVSYSNKETASVLRRFYDTAPNLELPPKPLRWAEVALQLTALYESLLRTSR